MLQRFLIKYRSTPSTVTSKTPNARIFIRPPKTLLDELNPKVRDNPQIKPEYESNPNIISFKKGDSILYKLQTSLNSYKWIPGIIQYRIGNVLYKIKTGNYSRNAHINQLRHNSISKNNNKFDEVLINSHKPISDNKTETKEIPELRRSKRLMNYKEEQ